MEPNLAPTQPIVFPVQSTTEPIQASAEQNFEPTKKSLPKWPLIIVGIILILVLVGGAYFLGQKSALTTQAPKTAQNSQISHQATSTPTPDPTAGWKTFSNQYYSFKYPPNWEININTGVVVAPTSVIATIKQQGAIGPAGGGLQDSIRINALADSLSLIPKIDETKAVTTKQVIISGIPSISYTTKYLQSLPGIPENSEITDVFISSGGKMYQIQLQLNKSTNIFGEMLSSFKFTDQAVQTNETTKIINDVIASTFTPDKYTHVTITGIYGNYAIGNSRYVGTGGGLEFYAHNENGIWKVIDMDIQVPGCSKFVNYPDLPKELTCDPSY
jgi:hypothetical protein